MRRKEDGGKGKDEDGGKREEEGGNKKEGGEGVVRRIEELKRKNDNNTKVTQYS